MEILRIKSDTLLDEGYKLLINQRKCVALSVSDMPFICTPRNGIVDEQLCYDLGYRVYEMLHNGGVIVVDPGDIDIAHFGDLRNNFGHDFANHLAIWLKDKRGLNAEFIGNDVLVDGYKVYGMGTATYPPIDYTTIHIGINTNLENIKKICTKPMEKIPKGLSEYGITTEEVEEMFLEFCEHYDDYKNDPTYS